MAGDAATFCELVLWARREGIVINALSVGSVHSNLVDPVAMNAADPKGTPAEAKSVLEDYGGPTLSEAVRKLAEERIS